MQLIYLFQRVAELIFAATYAQFYDYSCTGKTLKIGSLSMMEWYSLIRLNSITKLGIFVLKLFKISSTKRLASTAKSDCSLIVFSSNNGRPSAG